MNYKILVIFALITSVLLSGCLKSESDRTTILKSQKNTYMNDTYIHQVLSQNNNTVVNVGKYIDSNYYAGYIERVDIGKHEYSYWSGRDYDVDKVFLKGGMLIANNANKYVWIQNKIVVIHYINGEIQDIRYVD